nr:immunoglobulin heavy chain junction region [Macaca mulatta]
CVRDGGEAWLDYW